MAVSRGLVLAPHFVRLLPRSMRAKKVRLMCSSCVLLPRARSDAAVSGSSFGALADIDASDQRRCWTAASEGARTRRGGAFLPEQRCDQRACRA
eukprot:scaffold17615_cov107-Isochrysis_galbana.AAC.1